MVVLEGCGLWAVIDPLLTPWACVVWCLCELNKGRLGPGLLYA